MAAAAEGGRGPDVPATGSSSCAAEAPMTCRPTTASGSVTADAQDTVVVRNAAVTSARGTFLLVLEPGDVLVPSALGTLARIVDAAAEADVAYADEDLPAAGGEGPRELVMKPAWSPELLRHRDYIGTVRGDAHVTGPRGRRLSPRPPRREYDLTLRVTERARLVVHAAASCCAAGSGAPTDRRRARGRCPCARCRTSSIGSRSPAGPSVGGSRASGASRARWTRACGSASSCPRSDERAECPGGAGPSSSRPSAAR